MNMSRNPDYTAPLRRESRRGGFFTFLVGIAAGAAAGYYLSTEEGRRVRQRFQDRSTAFAQDAQSYARDSSTRGKSGLQDAVEKSRVAIDKLTADVKARAETVGADVKTRAEAVSTDVKTKVDELSAKAKTTVDAVSKDAKSKVDSVSGEVKARVDEYRKAAQDSASRSQSAFQEGVERGKAKLNQQKAEIDNLVKDGKDPKPQDDGKA